MAVHVTRCPHCQTSFRVRDEHLSVAKGMVRCGSCLQVFKAAEHFIDNPQAAKPVVAAARTEKAEQPQSTPVKSPPLKPEVSKAEARPVKPAVTPAKAEASTADDDDFGLIHDDMEDDPIPERLADDPFTDFNLRTPEHRSRPKPRDDLELDESIFNVRNADRDTLDFIGGGGDDNYGKAPDADESWANALLEDDDNSVDTSKISLDGADDFNYDLPPPEDDDFQGFMDEDEHHDEAFALNGDLDIPSEELSIELPPNNAPINVAVQDEPLDLGERTRRRIPWGWLSGILLMLIVAAAQTFYFNFDEWSRTPQWRPSYAKACELAGCQLPKVQNIRDMTTQNLVVRSHPTLQRALVVDALLLNKADYEQPFPDITLMFRDLNDNMVASRRFTPAQYLSGELSGENDMPVQTPVHIALELVDPGPEAVSYSISLQANQ